MKSSPLFSLNIHDAIKGLIMAAGGGLMAVIITDINSGNFDFNLTALWHGALVGAVPYIVKNFLTPADPTKEVTKTEDGTVTKTVVKTDQVDVKVGK